MFFNYNSCVFRQIFNYLLSCYSHHTIICTGCAPQLLQSTLLFQRGLDIIEIDTSNPPPPSMLLKQNIHKLLEEKLKKLNKLRPISKTLLQKRREKFEIEMTYNSNAIEGNTLTLKETYWVIQQGITVKGKPLKDHLEAKNHKEALDFLYELISN